MTVACGQMRSVHSNKSDFRRTSYDLFVSVLSGLSSSPRHYVVFLGKTPHSYSGSLHPGV